MDKLRLQQSKEMANSFDAATIKANKLAETIQATAGTISSNLADALASGMDKSGFMEKMKDMIKQMAVTAALAATGIQETISKIAKAIAGGEAVDVASQISALWNTASSVVNPIISAIDSQFASFMPAVPAFANGTNFAPGGIALVGEQGPELVNIPRGSRVSTAAETRSGAGRNVTFVFNSPQEMSPSDMMARARQSARQLAFEGAF